MTTHEELKFILLNEKIKHSRHSESSKHMQRTEQERKYAFYDQTMEENM